MTRLRRAVSGLSLAAYFTLAWQSEARAESPNTAPMGQAPVPPSGTSSGMRAAAPAEAVTDLAIPPLAQLLQGEARTDYEAGRLLYDSGDYSGALLKFQSAYDAAGDPRLLWNAAACERNLRHYVKASGFVRRFLASNSPLVTADAASRAQAFLDAAEPLTAPFEVETNAPNSEVYLDDELLGVPHLASQTRVDLGTHRSW